MKDAELISWLQNWYSTQCNGEWEHNNGVSIDTIDNPGWSIRIDLKGTFLENKSIGIKQVDRSDKDWIRYWAKKSVFEAAGGPGNLDEMINVFRRWVDEGII